MLMNMTDKVPPLVEKLRQSKFNFYLTGSRMWCDRAGTGPLKALFMAKKNVSSDWDLFVEDSFKVREWLLGNGFVIASDSQYKGDGQCNSVFEKQDTQAGVPVQIQLVTSAEAKNIVQEVLLKMYPNGFDSKLQASSAWRYGLEFYNTMTKMRKENGAK